MAKNTIRAAVITASDSRHADDDVSGTTLVGLLIAMGAEIAERRIVTDDTGLIREVLIGLAERGDIDLILTTGGTGFAPRDNTPEATRSVIERETPGIAEAIRRRSSEITPMAMLSRGVAGIRGKTLIINFPGSPKGVGECFEVVRPVLQHAIELIAGETGH
jgi:molybdopterin adenylyltransferase